MKKSLFIILGFVASVSLTSCFQHRVCATYVKNDVNQIEQTSADEVDQKM